MAHDVTRNRKFELDCALMCEEHDVPLVVIPQKLKNPAAPHRFAVVCPECLDGATIVAMRVDGGTRLTIPKGACVFNPEPHDCDGGWAIHMSSPIPPELTHEEAEEQRGFMQDEIDRLAEEMRVKDRKRRRKGKKK